jgi:DNA-binding transcriptional ArsR family regulator
MRACAAAEERRSPIPPAGPSWPGWPGVRRRAAPFAMSMAAVSKHLKVLERAGLITRGIEEGWSECLDSLELFLARRLECQ